MMSTFTICKRFVAACALDTYLARNTIFHFVHDYPLRIAVDENSKILNDYGQIALEYDIIASWLNLLSYRTAATDTIIIDNINVNNEELYYNICVYASSKKLICDSKQHYSDFPIEDTKIELFDRTEAQQEIQAQINNPVHNVYANAATFGNSSPLIQGDNNATKT